MIEIFLVSVFLASLLLFVNNLTIYSDSEKSAKIAKRKKKAPQEIVEKSQKMMLVWALIAILFGILAFKQIF